MKTFFNKSFLTINIMMYTTLAFSQSYTPGTNIQANRNTSVYSISSTTGSNDGSGIELSGNSSSGAPGSLSFIAGNTSYWRAYNFNKYTGTTWTPLLSITRDGRMGLGNFINDWDLVGKFQIGLDYKKIAFGEIMGSPEGGTSYLGFNAALQTDNAFGLNSNSTSNGGAVIYGTLAGGLNFATIKSGQYSSATNTQWATRQQMFDNNIRLSITPSGKVIIGNPTGINISSSAFETSTFSLLVTGGIRAEQIKVDLKASWSDFVFDKNYKLPTLKEVESYIGENHHLSGIPSAEEVKSEGINVAEMDAKLLQKIEELTLYMIEMKKENEAFRKALEEQNNKIKFLEIAR